MWFYQVVVGPEQPLLAQNLETQFLFGGRNDGTEVRAAEVTQLPGVTKAIGIGYQLSSFFICGVGSYRWRCVYLACICSVWHSAIDLSTRW
jgi:hypothetical protein